VLFRGQNEKQFQVLWANLILQIQQASETSSHWLLYIAGVKNVLRSARLNSVERNSDLAPLLYWVFYHDILAQFSLRYWRHHYLAKETRPGELGILVQQLSIRNESEVGSESSLPDKALLITQKQVSNISLQCYCLGTLRLISEVFNLVWELSDTCSSGVSHRNLLTILEWKIRKLPVLEEHKHPHPGQTVTEDSMMQEVVQLTLLVYIERVTGSSPGQSENMRSRIGRAFAIFSLVETWQRQFPLLILGCEARTDEERLVILDLISRTEENTSVRSLGSMKGILQSLWAQDDLAERELGYTDKIRAVLSSSEILPSFI